MTQEQFESLSQGCFFLPRIDDTIEESEAEGDALVSDASASTSVAFDCGGFVRLEDTELDDEGRRWRCFLYEKCWDRCANRIEEVSQELNEDFSKNVLDFVSHAYEPIPELEDVVLPYHEIPTGLLLGAGNTSPTIQLLVSRLTSLSGTTTSPVKVARLTSKECSSLKSALRAVIAKLVGDEVQRISRASFLAPEDTHILEVWYRSFKGSSKRPKPVIVIEDFEAFDSCVLQDLIQSISSLVPSLPFVLLLGITTSADALHTMLPHQSLVRLGIQRFEVRSGKTMFDGIMKAMFFDTHWQPDVFIGPETFGFLRQRFFEHDGSIDALVSGLQLVYLHHFLSRPLSIFTSPSTSLPVIQNHPKSFSPELYTRLRLGLVDVSSDTGVQTGLPLSDRRRSDEPVKVRIPAFLDVFGGDDDETDVEGQEEGGEKGDVARANGVEPTSTSTPAGSPSTLLTRLLASDAALIGHLPAFCSAVALHARRRALAMDLLELAQDYLRTAPSLSAVSGAFGRGLRRTSEELMAVALRGRLGETIVARVGEAIRKLSSDDSRRLAELVTAWLHQQESVSSSDLDMKAIVRRSLKTWAEVEQRLGLTEADGTAPSTVEDVAQSFLDMLGSLVEYSHSSLPMHEIWYYDSDKHLSLLLNPIIRRNILAGLSDPHAYLSCPCCCDPAEAGSNLPDICLAYHRYRDSGRLVNLFDWYESFALALEVEEDAEEGQADRGSASDRGRRRVQERGTPSSTPTSTPSKKRATGTPGKRRRGEEEEKEKGADATPTTPATADADADVNGEDGRRQREVQARFARAVNELGYLGLLRQTKRKTDHCARANFDLPFEPDLG